MRRFLVRFSESEASNHTPSLADFTTTTPELKFSVHTTSGRAAARRARCDPQSAGRDLPYRIYFSRQEDRRGRTKKAASKCLIELSAIRRGRIYPPGRRRYSTKATDDGHQLHQAEEKTSRSAPASPCRILRGTDKRWIVSVAMIPEGMDIEGLHARAPANRPSCGGLLPAFLGRSADR
jgi:hypothetical protein